MELHSVMIEEIRKYKEDLQCQMSDLKNKDQFTFIAHKIIAIDELIDRIIKSNTNYIEYYSDEYNRWLETA